MNSEQQTVIGAQTHVAGSLRGDEELTILGRVDGNIHSGRGLVVEASGVVVAETVEVGSAIIRGTLVGNINASELIEISAGGKVVGDLAAPRILLAEGALFRGMVDMGPVDGLESLPEMRPEPTVKTTPRRTRVVEEPVQEELIEEPVTKPLRPAPQPARPPRRAEPPAPRRVERAPAPAAARKAPRGASASSLQSRASAAAKAVVRAVKKDPPAPAKKAKVVVKPAPAPAKKVAAKKAPAKASKTASKASRSKAAGKTKSAKAPKPPTTAGRKTRAKRK